jgi:lysophospholipase L1-like esterase
MQWYEPEIRALIKQLRERRPAARPAVFYGSSSIRMWTDLTADLGDNRILNVGFGGSTLAACVHFFERLVPPLQPGSVTVYAGDNDLGDGRKPEQVFQSFRTLAGLMDRLLPAVPFNFISIKPSPARENLRSFIEQTNELIRREIQRHSYACYIDVFSAMLDGDGQPRSELFLDDGLHLSRAGYKVWVQILQRHRNRIFTHLLNGVADDGLRSGIT